jgi:hypothetical protein
MREERERERGREKAGRKAVAKRSMESTHPFLLIRAGHKQLEDLASVPP